MIRSIVRGLGVVAIAAVASPVVQAVQVADGTVYFDRPPSLVGASTTFDRVRSWNATYFFTLDLPEDAGEPLQQVAIAQHERPAPYMRYRLEDTYSFEGRRRDRGDPLSLGNVTHDEDTQTVTVTFDPPVEPGTAITVALRPVRNPSFSGVYLFGVTAYPAGDKAYGQFLGFGRLHFYSSDFGWWW
ncbi:DUF2808 domain-containing protein [Baaleninema simplex]|uniref:DUF2808 domain-containing protein n=1 Tax=Baaleninema simplex TaxID=2862350 RepID=UPI000475ABA6|nr:DUF2808 domain-containing protein [Baaleninema simplex]